MSCVPHERLRRWMNNAVSLIGFRIIARSISAVITIHNEEYKPKNCGFCVANHTSPMDVSILASNCTFSLVSKQDASSGICTLYVSLKGVKEISCGRLIECFPFSFVSSTLASHDSGLLAYILYSISRLLPKLRYKAKAY